MHHIYHSLFSAIAAHEAANTQVAGSHTATSSNIAKRSAPCGSFALRTGRAMALQPHAASLLHISQGAAWVTLPSQTGDHFLQTGDSLRVEAGDRVVMEPWHTPASQMTVNETLYFDWDPVPLQVAKSIAAPQAAQQVVALRGSWHRLAAQPAPRASYCAAVLAPLADLRAAAVLGAGAAARLTVGLATWGLAAAWRTVLAGAARFATALVAARAVFSLA
jgi:Protein of unknown function (DUF2917)